MREFERIRRCEEKERGEGGFCREKRERSCEECEEVREMKRMKKMKKKKRLVTIGENEKAGTLLMAKLRVV